MSFTGVLFDVDGTLLDTVELIIQSYQHTFRTHLGREVPEERILAGIGSPLVDHLSLYAADPGEVATMVETYRAFNMTNHDRLTKVFPGVQETVRSLAEQGLKLGVVSSKIRRPVLRGLQLFDLSRYFQTAVCLEDTERHKPDPAPVLLALEQLGVAAEDALMVGDSPADLEAGRRAGTATAAVGWSTFSRAQLAYANPDYVLERMEDLLALCRKGGGDGA